MVLPAKLGKENEVLNQDGYVYTQARMHARIHTHTFNMATKKKQTSWQISDLEDEVMRRWDMKKLTTNRLVGRKYVCKLLSRDII